MELHADWVDIAGTRRFAKGVKALGSPKMFQAESRAVNHTGYKSRTKVRRALTAQTGLKRKVIVHAVKVKRSSPGTLTFQMSARGGDVGLKYFKARETRKGVMASPFGKRTLFEGAFIRGGNFPGRVGLKLGGHVFTPSSSSSRWFRPFTKTKSGVVIPNEMVKDDSADAFTSTVQSELPSRLAHEVSRLTGGTVS